MIERLKLMNARQYSKFLGLGLLFWAAGCAPAAGGGGDGKPEDMEAEIAAALCLPAEYDLSCMKDDKTSASDGVIDLVGGLKDDVLGMAGEGVSDARQDEYGDNSRKEIEGQFPVVENHPKTEFLEGLLHKLLQLRRDPTEIGYHIYVVRSPMVNAFTMGGEIYVTEALLKESGSTDELACIIGHEIGHNELGHIAKQLEQLELSQKLFGDEAGEMVANAVGMLTMGFNQKNEAEADLYGIDLALAAGYNACRGIDFWDRMKGHEGEANDFDNFFRSHPYSSRRANCYRSHLSSLHKLSCDN